MLTHAHPSHCSVLTFVLTPRQDFYSILRHRKWGDAHFLLMILTHRQLCLLYCRCTHTHTFTPLRCILRLQSSQGSCCEGSMMVSAPPDLHSKSLSPLLQHSNSQEAKQKHTINLPWNETLSLKNVCGFMHSMKVAWKCTSTYKSAIVNNKLNVKWRFTLKCCWT